MNLRASLRSAALLTLATACTVNTPAGSDANSSAKGGGAGAGGQANATITAQPVTTAPPPIPDGATRVAASSTADKPDGSAAKPFHSIQEALAAGKKDLRLCGDFSLEKLVITTNGVTITGGYACSDWASTSTPSRLTASASPAVSVVGATDVKLSTLVVEAPSGTAAARSSIAVFLSQATGAMITQVQLLAGNGSNGSNGTLTPYTLIAAGSGAAGGTGGKGCPSLQCPAGDETAGGDGAGQASAGDSGLPVAPNPPYANNGSQPASNSCLGGGSGAAGTSGPTGASAPSPLLIDAAGLTLSRGAAGSAGLVGQGGGGGSGSPTNSGRGGGGGCGGCGGAGATGAEAGGWSIALLSFESSVAVDHSTLVTANGGSGGNATLGQPGVGGGDPGMASNGYACPGGRGGAGGNGGAGQAGNGGSSVGALYVGTKPALDGSVTFDLGRAGNAGTPIENNTATVAAAGQAAKSLDAAAL